ncbi:putative gag-polypeptide of LTR copia-type [Rosa chinensis]|uniref:Putative gag-polypeptide of LTR copia-type n=1 Tax=Rosa chinensis TaxID=74649 RepID=A0A2P6SFR9_ROSCH|nr:putative gag-polypeptide of LTR copia-type [Rosa chinensis]
MITVKLTENNFVKWSYQFQSVLDGNDIFGFFDGTSPSPPQYVFTEEEGVTTEVTQAYKIWKKTDKALLSLLIATLDDDTMEIIVGCKSSRQAWLSLQERFSTVSRANIMQLKTDLQTIKKGADSIERYLLRVKHARDQLNSVGVTMSDEDIIVVTLNGLPDEFAMLKMVIRGRETPISMRDFKSQLLAAERDIESQFQSHSSLSAMVARNDSQRSFSSQQYPSNDSDDINTYEKLVSWIKFS